MTIQPITTPAPARVVWRKRVRLEQVDGHVTARFRDAVDVKLLAVTRGNVGLNVYAEVTPAKDRPVEPTEFHFAVVATGAPVPADGEYAATVRAIVTDGWTTERPTVHLYRVPALPEADATEPLFAIDGDDAPSVGFVV